MAEDITCAAAVTAGNALGDNVTDSTATVSVVGYVSIAEAWKSDSKQQIFYMADDSASTSKEFEAYYCNTEVAIKRGDKVRVTGYLTKYVSKSNVAQVEIKNGNVELLQAAEEQGPKEIKLYTVSEVIAAYDNGTLIEGDSCMVVGTISKWYTKSSKFDTYHSVSYFITDGQKEFEMYNSYSVDNAKFETYDYTDETTATCIDENGLQLNIGDSVIGIGTVKKYNDTYEFNQNCYLVWTNAGGAEVETADVVFAMEDFAGKGTSGTGSEVTVTKGGVTFTCDKAYGDGQYGVRCYKGSTITISSDSEQIGKIVFVFGLDKTGGLDEEIVVNDMSWTATLSDEQARMNKISIYFGEYEKPAEDTIPELPEGVITCDSVAKLAAAAADPTADNKNVEVCEVKVRGFVTFCYDAEDGQQSAWIADEKKATAGTVQGYYLNVTDAVAKGDYVQLEGTLVKYFKAGKDGKPDEIILEVTNGTMAKVGAQGIENIVLTEKAQKVMVDGVIYIVRDNKMFNLQGAQVR